MTGYAESTKLENNRNCLRRIARHDELQFSKHSIVNMMEKFVKTVNIMDDTILVPCRLMDRQVGDSTDIIPAPGKDSTSNQLTQNSGVHGKRGAEQSRNVHEFLTSADLFNLYTMLNALKKDLLWTGKDEAIDTEDYIDGVQRQLDDARAESEPKTDATNITTAAAVAATSAGGATVGGVGKGHNRRPSTASVASTASVCNLSDTESDISNENDSGVESEGNKSDTPQSSSSADSISSSEDVCGQQKKLANTDKATELAHRCKRHLNGLFQCLEQMTEAANYLTARYQSDIGPV